MSRDSAVLALHPQGTSLVLYEGHPVKSGSWDLSDSDIKSPSGHPPHVWSEVRGQGWGPQTLPGDLDQPDDHHGHPGLRGPAVCTRGISREEGAHLHEVGRPAAGSVLSSVRKGTRKA